MVERSLCGSGLFGILIVHVVIVLFRSVLYIQHLCCLSKISSNFLTFFSFKVFPSCIKGLRIEGVVCCTDVQFVILG